METKGVRPLCNTAARDFAQLTVEGCARRDFCSSDRWDVVPVVRV